MKDPLKKLLVITIALLPSLNVYGQYTGPGHPKTLFFPFDEKHWSTKSENVEFITHKLTKAVQSSDESPFEIVLKDFEFAIGTIEFDVELRGRGFPGIHFHLDEETENSETYYLRYFGQLDPISRNTMQYAAVIDGINLWDITDDYQAAASLMENEWNHIKMVVSENQMKVYVNTMERAALHVPNLEGLTKTGKISLRGNVIYANMRITPNAIEDLPNGNGYDPTYNDSNYIRHWEVLDPIPFPMGKDIMEQINTSPGVTINGAYFDGTKKWRPIKAGARAVINLTKEFGAGENGSRRLTWLRTTISSEKEQEKILKLGFSDEVWVFINGQPLHQDKNYYGSPGMKKPKGRCSLDNTLIKVPLEKGKNEVLIGITNYFFGWGLIARLENTDGLGF